MVFYWFQADIRQALEDWIIWKTSKNIGSTNQFRLIFILFHQAAHGEKFPDDLTPMDVYMPVIGKCL